MPITVRTRAVFHCKCIHPECAHEWEAVKKPKRCAKCKRHTWNGEDHRYGDPFNGVPIRSQIKAGTEAPRLPSGESMLETFLKTKKIIEDIVDQNPCDHNNNVCVCTEKDVLAEIDQHIEKLRALLPRRSTYLVQTT